MFCEVLMKKVCILMCFCIISLFFSSCANNEEISMEKFNQFTATYKNKIQAIDTSLVIYEVSTLITRDGEYIKVFSIETSSKGCFGVRLTVTSANRAKLLIEFNDANDNWTVENITLFAHFISELTNYEIYLPKIQTAIDTIQKSDGYRFDKNARLFWDDYHCMLYFEEKFRVDLSP